MDWQLLDESAGYLVGVSGGRDSVFLLRQLVERGFENLVVAHLNHGLRGADSDGDEDFCRALAAEFSLPFFSEKVTLEDHGPVETQAREARLAFFEKVALQNHLNHVLLAHHADDQAETILHNLLRGSLGLKGMQPRHEISSLTILRPLLNVRRAEIEAFFKERGHPFREDATNADPFTARNRLRHEALPLLAGIMGRDITPALTRAANTQRNFHDLLPGLGLLDPQGRLFLPKVRELPASLRSLVLHQFLKEKNVANLSQRLIAEAEQLVISAKGPAQINLPGDKRLRRKEQRAWVENLTDQKRRP